MPRVEQLRHAASRLLLLLRLRLAFLGCRIFGRLIPRQPGVIFLPLAIGLAVAAIVFAARSSSGPDCGQLAQASAITGHAHASRLCKAEPEPLGFAR